MTDTKILVGDARDRLRELPDKSVHCVITSPPYWGLRSYKGDSGMIGLEATFEEHLANLLEVFQEVHRVLRDDGTFWLNYGDAYAGSGKGHTNNKSPGLSKSFERGCPDSTQLNITKNMGKIQKGALGTLDLSPAPKDALGLKPKDLMMMPARVAMALQADGWWLRSEIVWHKPNPMPESCRDRPTCSHEKMFLLSKSAKYFYDAEAVKTTPVKWPPNQPGSRLHGDNKDRNDNDMAERFKNKHKDGNLDGGHRSKRWPGIGPQHSEERDRGETYKDMTVNEGVNLRNVWKIPTQGYTDAHFATFPPALVEPCIKAGTPEGGAVLDPFSGSGTVGLVAAQLNRNSILIEISPEYAEMAKVRIEQEVGNMFHSIEVIQ